MLRSYAELNNPLYILPLPKRFHTTPGFDHPKLTTAARLLKIVQNPDDFSPRASSAYD